MSRNARVLALLFLVGCGGDNTRELAVDVLTDFVPEVEFDTIVIEVVGEESRRFMASNTGTYSTGVRLTDFVLPEGDLEVSGRLMLGERVVIDNVHRVALRTDLGMTFVFPRSCEGVVCGAGEACVAGACTDDRCTPETPDFCPTPECLSATDCIQPVCGVRSCASGTCLQSDDGSCGAGLYCSPAVGCLPRPGETDAGTDASMPDAGPDASIPDAGPDTFDGGCQPETDAELCTLRSRACGRATATDRCGSLRALECGECADGTHCAGATCEACFSSPCDSGTFTDFEGGTGTVDEFEGWKVNDCAPYDQELVDDGTGNTVLRFSNAVATSCISSMLSDCPAGHVITPETWESNPDLFAGEPSLSVTYNRFVHEMRFRSATGGAQMDLWMELSSDDGNGRRQSRTIINDVGTGLRVIDLAGRILFSGLSYDEWHTIRIETLFLDGEMNDTVLVSVDGVASSIRPLIGTLETYYRVEEPAAGITAVQCTLFHPGIADRQVPALAGGGLLFDDVATWLETDGT